jgi:hypothetical protein
MRDPKFHNAKNQLTVYALSCGYKKVFDIEGSRVTMWQENNCYHVRHHDHGNGLEVGIGRIEWQSFRTVKEARRKFSSIKNSIKGI